MTIISPSILAADFLNLEQDIKKINDSNAQWIHLDVMDGLFVPNITFGYDLVSKIRPLTKLTLDVHLMIEDPIRYVEQFTISGADIITFHLEAYENSEEVLNCINKIKSFGVKVGLALNPGTDIENISEFIEQLDMILIMSVNPGFGGQSFNSNCIDKIKYIRKLNENILIQVDGGINNNTAKLVKDAGANVLVAGSYIFNNDINTAINNLK